MKTYVIILAGGKGERMKAPVNKTLLKVSGKTVIIRSLSVFVPYADEFVIAARQEEHQAIRNEIENSGLSFSYCFADGGLTRQASVLNCVRSISPDPDDIILIHDAARCLVQPDLIERIIRTAKDYGAGIPGLPACSTYKMCDSDSFVVSTPNRSALFEIQTPQGFLAGKIVPCLQKAANEGIDCTDDAGVLEYYHVPVKVVPGDSSNIKLTEPADLSRARSILEGGFSLMRTGMGYDVHRLVPGRKLILCGVDIPFDLGLLGHSDADVALHALMDAMLGAAGLGDIGRHFPDTDESYKNISSVLLLRKTSCILLEHGYTLWNADITIVAQKPRIMPFIHQMRETVASALNLPVDNINIKATTTETLGFEGRMEGISAYAVCTVFQKD